MPEPTLRTAADDSVGTSLSPWRQTCIAEAQLAAELDECHSWRVDTSQSIPFHHRWEHVQQVAKLALLLAAETGADAEIVEAAAWLHDVRKSDPDHAAAGAAAAEEILLRTDFPRSKRAVVVDAIARHEGLTRADAEPLQPLEAAVLWDADKLSKIGVQALIFNVSTKHFWGKSLAERRTDNLAFVERVLAQTVASMNTPLARRLAAERYRAMLEVLAQWGREEACELLAAGEGGTDTTDR